MQHGKYLLNGLLRAARTEYQVGTAGNRTRYPCGMYEVHEKSGSFSQDQVEWYRDNDD